MCEIIVTTSQLSSKAEELNRMNEQFRNAVECLKNEEGTLRGQYEGEASDAFHRAFTSDTTQMQNFYNAIAQYVQKLLLIAQTYEKAERANVNTATTRTYC